MEANDTVDSAPAPRLTDRQKVFLRANEAKIETGKSISVCLAWSWRVHRFLKRLRDNQEVEFTFEKKTTGELRRAKGTLNFGVIPRSAYKGEGNREINWHQNFKQINYFDLGVGEFRSFKLVNLIEVFEPKPEKKKKTYKPTKK